MNNLFRTEDRRVGGGGGGGNFVKTFSNRGTIGGRVGGGEKKRGKGGGN